MAAISTLSRIYRKKVKKAQRSEDEASSEQGILLERMRVEARRITGRRGIFLNQSSDLEWNLRVGDITIFHISLSRPSSHLPFNPWVVRVLSDQLDYMRLVGKNFPSYQPRYRRTFLTPEGAFKAFCRKIQGVSR